MNMHENDDSQSDITISGSFQPRRLVQNSRFGVVRLCSSLTCMEIFFLVVSTISLLSTLGLSIYKLATVNKEDDYSDFIFAILIVFNTVVCFYYAIYGIFWERFFEILVFCIAVTTIIVYIIVNFVDTAGWKDIIKIVRLVLASIFGPVCITLGCILAKDFHNSGALIIRTVGAAMEFATACMLLFTLQAVLKLDLQLGVTLLILVGSGHIDTKETVLLSVGAPLVLLWFIIAMIGSRYEKKWLMWIFFPVGIICGPAYYIYRIYLASEAIRNGLKSERNIGVVSMAACTLALLVRLVALILGVFVYRNFNRGLKQRLDHPRLGTQTAETTTSAFARM